MSDKNKNVPADDTAISVKGVSKYFSPSTGQRTVKQMATSLFKKKKSHGQIDGYWALRDVSFDIKKGEFFGIVGRNGSGKSTLLKMIAGVYTPTAGAVKTNGMIVPFIELGVGFNPELNGRDNVFLNGALLGFSRKEMEKMYSEIVSFAELEEHMGVKLKNFSSGMQVRLAFSIAIRANSDILLIDEVLAVGDEAFQRKCFSYFDKLKREKKTVVLVTHDMSAVERFCTRAIFIEDGVIKTEGKPHIVAAAYSRSNDASYAKSSSTVGGVGDTQFSLEVLDEKYAPSRSFKYGDTMIVRMKWNSTLAKNAGVAIFRDNGEYVFGPNTYQDKYKNPAKNTIEYIVDLNLNDGGYFLKAGITGKTDSDTIAFIEEGPHFSVSRDYSDGRWGGVTKLKYTWR